MGPDPAASSDAELLLLIRAGDLGAMGELYARHREAALRVARAITGDPYLAEDLVGTAFERVHGALVRGHGPDDSFRAYLYTVIRRLAADYGEQRSREDDVGDWLPYEAETALGDETDGSIESRLVARAFGSLPDRHQAVLWYLDVEGMTPAQTAPILGLSPNAVSALAIRARGALRAAYLQAHVSDSPVRADCAPVRRLMGAYVRGTLSKRDHAKVDAHLEQCDECPVVLHELRDVSRGLQSVFGPIIIGGFGIGAGAVAALASGAQSASAAAAVAAGSGTAAAGAVGIRVPRPPASLGQTFAVGAVVVVGALVATTVVSAVASGAATSDDVRAAVESAPPDDYPTAPLPPSRAQSPSPSLAPSSTPAPRPVASPSPRATPAPESPAVPAVAVVPPATAALDLDITDDGDDGTGSGGRLGTIVVDVRNTDSDPITATLRVRLPDGMSFDAMRVAAADPSWTCATSDASTRTCTSAGLPGGAERSLSIPVTIAASDLGARPIANLSITR